MSDRIVRSVREATTGFGMPSIHTRVRWPSPRSSPRIGSSAKILSSRAYFPKPRKIMRGSAAMRISITTRTDSGPWNGRRSDPPDDLAAHGVHRRLHRDQREKAGEQHEQDADDAGAVGVEDG